MSELQKGSKASSLNKISQSVAVHASNPFADKSLPDGRKLYLREHGISSITIGASQTGSLVFEIPYISTKINGAMIVGCKMGDTVNFKVLDTSDGDITGVPMYPLNQFGYNVNMTNDTYYKRYAYDADLSQGMHICIEYTNNGNSEITVAANLELHEVKDL